MDRGAGLGVTSTVKCFDDNSRIVRLVKSEERVLTSDMKEEESREQMNLAIPRVQWNALVMKKEEIKEHEYK